LIRRRRQNRHNASFIHDYEFGYADFAGQQLNGTGIGEFEPSTKWTLGLRRRLALRSFVNKAAGLLRGCD
jgi:hypothetical protein